jgi:hypothetical protein
MREELTKTILDIINPSIYDYAVICDETTPEDIDNGRLSISYTIPIKGYQWDCMIDKDGNISNSEWTYLI